MKKILTQVIKQVTRVSAIEYLMIEQTESETYFKAFCTRKRVFFLASTPRIEELEANACLANLSFLSRLFAMGQFADDDSTMEMRYRNDNAGNNALEKIIFKGKSAVVEYPAMDAAMTGLKMPTGINVVLPVTVEVSADMCDEIKSMSNLQNIMMRSSGIKNEEARVSLKKENNIVTAEFEYPRSNTVLTLDDNNVGDDINIPLPLNTADFQLCAELIRANEGGTIKFGSSAMQVEFNSDEVEYKVMVRRIQERI